MRVFQFPSEPKYSCAANAHPLTLGSTETDEKSPNLSWVLMLPETEIVPAPAMEASRASWQDRRVESLEFDTSIARCEAPVDVAFVHVALMHPGSDLLDQCGFVGDAAI